MSIIYKMEEGEQIDETLLKLITTLHKIDKDTTLIVRQDGHYCLSQQIIKDAVELANDCLIDDGGHIIRKHIDLVVMEEFPTYAGDMDRYGWLTGIIELSRGIIMFG
jgi:hypothetical protein